MTSHAAHDRTDLLLMQIYFGLVIRNSLLVRLHLMMKSMLSNKTQELLIVIMTNQRRKKEEERSLDDTITVVGR
jgi:hypothetical protein